MKSYAADRAVLPLSVGWIIQATVRYLMKQGKGYNNRRFSSFKPRIPTVSDSGNDNAPAVKVDTAEVTYDEGRRRVSSCYSRQAPYEKQGNDHECWNDSPCRNGSPEKCDRKQSEQNDGNSGNAEQSTKWKAPNQFDNASAFHRSPTSARTVSAIDIFFHAQQKLWLCS
jgi:hypothetical protein